MSRLPHLRFDPESEDQWFQALIDLARYLRGPEGCPWDREQSAADFMKYAQGEAEELVDAANAADNAHFAEEFGDTLFTLLAGAAGAEAEGRFQLVDALKAAHEKMVRRHEHVFGENKAATPEEAVASWNAAKQRERAKDG